MMRLCVMLRGDECEGSQQQPTVMDFGSVEQEQEEQESGTSTEEGRRRG